MRSRKANIGFDRKLSETLKKRIEPYYIRVGILRDGPHYAPVERIGKNKSKGIKAYAGGPARKQTRTQDSTLARVSANVRKHLGFNYLTRPFSKKGRIDSKKFVYAFMKMALGQKLNHKKRCENALQALVRNPILRGDYGRNSRATAKRKGFNRKLIDTSQFFRAITAHVRIRV